MIIGGFTKFSLIDYPNKTSAILFTQGCNLRCPFCHNPELVKPELFEKSIPFEEIANFLKKRIGLVDAVEFTGGEPTLQKDLKEAIVQVKSLGFFVKLDTNGTNPEIVRELLSNKLIDYIAMDIKSSIDRYDDAAGMIVDKDKIIESIQIIKNSLTDYEFRTTMIREIVGDEEDIEKIGEMIKGSNSYYFQKPHFDKMLSKDFKGEAFKDTELLEFKKIMERYVDFVGVR